MNIIKILAVDGYTLAIYYTSSDCYRYTIIDRSSVATESYTIFYTAEAAEREAREVINIVSS